jgi:hypothetical protein
VISVELDDKNQRITGTEKITYKNNSPDMLLYLWLQLDQNLFAPHSMTALTQTMNMQDRVPFGMIERLDYAPKYAGGFKIKSVKNAGGDSMRYTVNFTMMRVDLPRELPPGGSVDFSIDWEYNINPSKKIGGRTGAEFWFNAQALLLGKANRHDPPKNW